MLAVNPAAVVLLIGTNDLEEGATPDVITGNLKLIVAALEQHDRKMPIVLCQVFPSSATKMRPADQVKALNAAYLAAVKGDAQITVLDTWRLFADADGDAPQSEFPDLLHPNATGYAKWAAALRPVLGTLGFVDTTADAFTPDAGFESLFNGRDLTGWGFRPTSETDRANAKKWQASDPNAAMWPFVDEASPFDGKTSTPDGRFRAIAGRLVVTTPAEGRRIQQLWTTKEFGEDFILKLQFRATPNADSGVYLRGPQLQCRDYLLAGPYKELKRYKPQDWNDLVVTVHGGVALATCNGEVLESNFKLPASGPIGVEGDRGQMEYRHIQLKRLPGGRRRHEHAGARSPARLRHDVRGSLGQSEPLKRRVVLRADWFAEGQRRIAGRGAAGDHRGGTRIHDGAARHESADGQRRHRGRPSGLSLDAYWHQHGARWDRARREDQRLRGMAAGRRRVDCRIARALRPRRLPATARRSSAVSALEHTILPILKVCAAEPVAGSRLLPSSFS